MLGVYVHIPFCERKCNYCAFSSFVREKNEQEKYVDSLIKEIKEFKDQNSQEKHHIVDTIFIGGGTPSLLADELFLRIVEALKMNFQFSEKLEFTVECNPNSLTKEKLKFYKKMGVNRISLGVQSLDDGQLSFIGRLHDSKGAVEAIKNSLAEFENVSCDLLIGIKDMKADKFLSSLEYLVDLGIKHISTYMLQLEDGTPLAKLANEKETLLPDDEQCVEVYNQTVSFLKKKGFDQYEVSNFAVAGYECKHNIKYWTGEEYIGFGLSAHSYIDGKRFANAKTFDEYYNRKFSMCEKLTDAQKIEEHIMLGLRCNKGINKRFLSKLGYDIEGNEYLAEYISRGIIYENEEKTQLFLNPDYYGVNNFIIVHLLPEIK